MPRCPALEWWSRALDRCAGDQRDQEADRDPDRADHAYSHTQNIGRSGSRLAQGEDGYAEPVREFEQQTSTRLATSRAIDEIAASVGAGNRFQTLLSATGTGKTATMAWTIEKIQRPALVIAHNKTLAAQLCNEFREFFPENAVEYFVSYYDYYQPEAYLPQADLYIEKDSSQNDDIAWLRLSATSSLMTRRDVVVVASVSCIYGLGSPEEWRERVILDGRSRIATTSSGS